MKSNDTPFGRFEKRYALIGAAIVGLIMVGFTTYVVADVMEANTVVDVVELHEPTVDAGRAEYPAQVRLPDGQVKTFVFDSELVDAARANGTLDTIELDGDALHGAYPDQATTAIQSGVMMGLLSLLFAMIAAAGGSSLGRTRDREVRRRERMDRWDRGLTGVSTY